MLPPNMKNNRSAMSSTKVLLMVALLAAMVMPSSRSSPVDEVATPPVYIPSTAAPESSTSSPTVFDTVSKAAEAVMPALAKMVPSVPTLTEMTSAAPVERAAESSTITEGTTTTTTTEASTTTTTASTTMASSSGSGILSNSISGSSSSGDGGASGIVALLGGTTAKPEDKKNVPVGNFDKHLDGILGNLGKVLRTNGFDPIRIGSLLQCKNCTMEGLSLVRRTGPANLQYANRSLTVDAHLGLPALYIHCFPCTDVILMVPFTGMLEVALWDLSIYGKVVQKVERGASPQLLDYRVEKEGTLDISLNGYGLLGPVAELGFKIIHQRRVSDIIREFVYERVPAFIQEKMKGFNLPLGK